MSKVIFSEKDMKILRENLNVLTVFDKSITYLDTFKIHFIEEHLKGKLPRLKDLSQDKMQKNKLLKGQVELLKKLDKIERSLVNKTKNIQANKAFELINQTISKYKLTNMSALFCKIIGVSCSGYYRHISTEDIRKQHEN